MPRTHARTHTHARTPTPTSPLSPRAPLNAGPVLRHEWPRGQGADDRGCAAGGGRDHQVQGLLRQQDQEGAHGRGGWGLRRQRVLGRGLHLALPCPCSHPLSSVPACRAEPGHRSPQTRLAQPRKHMHPHSPPPQVSARWISTDQANPLGPSEPGGTRPFTWRSTEVRALSLAQH